MTRLVNGRYQNFDPVVARRKFILKVDYTKKIKQAVADGNYDAVGYLIKGKYFPCPLNMYGKKIQVIARLFLYTDDMSYSDIKLEMFLNGYRQANLRELLCFVSTYPEESCHSIIALDSIFVDDHGLIFSPYVDSPSTNWHRISTIGVSGVWLNGFIALGIQWTEDVETIKWTFNC